MAAMSSSPLPDPRVVERPDQRLLDWIVARRGIVQLSTLGVAGLPWVAVSLWGLRWAWIALALWPLAAYLLVVTLMAEDPEDDDADG